MSEVTALLAVPLTRIRAVIAGKAAHAIPPVLAQDVLVLTTAVPEDKQTEVTRALHQGATTTVSGLSPMAAGQRVFHPQAGDLAQLVEIVGGNAQ